MAIVDGFLGRKTHHRRRARCSRSSRSYEPFTYQPCIRVTKYEVRVIYTYLGMYVHTLFFCSLFYRRTCLVAGPTKRGSAAGGATGVHGDGIPILLRIRTPYYSVEVLHTSFMPGSWQITNG